MSSHDPHTTMKTEQEPSRARIRGPVSSHDFRPQIRALVTIYAYAREMLESAFDPRNQPQGPKNVKYILRPAQFHYSRYSFRTKPCKYYEMGRCQFGKKCRFFHDPRGPRTFDVEKYSKNLRQEIHDKFEDILTQLKNSFDKQTAEIVHLKKLLIDRLDAHPLKTEDSQSLGKAHSSTFTFDDTNTTERKSLLGISEQEKTNSPTNLNIPTRDQIFRSVDKGCGYCGQTAKLRCSKCKEMYYCSSAHQSVDWANHKSFCSLVSEDPTNTYKSFDIIKDQEAVILQVKVKKTKKSLGLYFNSIHSIKWCLLMIL